MYKKAKSIIIVLFFAFVAHCHLFGMFVITDGKDGCIVNARESGSWVARMCEGISLESNFVKRDGVVQEIGPLDASQGRNAYRVKALPCLRQPKSGPCGFYSLFHLSQMYKDQTLLDRDTFEDSFHDIYKYCDASGSGDMQKYVTRHMKYFTKENFTIASGGKESNRKIIILTDGWGREIRRKEMRDEFLYRVKEFQRNGTAQYLVIGTDVDVTILDVTLDWDNKNDRLHCIPNHWIALKIEWQGLPGQSPVILSVADSGSSKDLRYAELIHWYYHKFVHAHDFYLEREPMPAPIIAGPAAEVPILDDGMVGPVGAERRRLEPGLRDRDLEAALAASLESFEAEEARRTAERRRRHREAEEMRKMEEDFAVLTALESCLVAGHRLSEEEELRLAILRSKYGM